MLLTKPNFMWIVFAILFNIFDQNFAASLRCYYESFSNYTEVQLKNPDSLITDSNSCIDTEKGTMILANGFGNDPDNGEAIRTIISTYISLGNVNVILLDWSRESKGIPGLGPLGFPVALTNSKTVGEQLATAVLRLVELGMSRDIHFVGHSLGCHLLGQAGRKCIEQNLTIPWITALEPARPGFDSKILSVYPPVDPSCAKFVEAYHTDPGGYGLNTSVGHVDVYFNYGLYLNGTRRQPGCGKSKTLEEFFSHGNRCSHDRSWQYYCVALKQPTLFEAGKAGNYQEWVEQNGHFNITIYLGSNIDKQQRGDFFCTTSASEPWGKQDEGLVPSESSDDDDECDDCNLVR